ncbi:alpha-L-fucosidase-domain-containing protein [Mrakia frigida]|uniref:alpha-L-fucosidase n=1 Tax=Mrakia frigida TaxID=29902 RepID=UPI003FCC0202
MCFHLLDDHPSEDSLHSPALFPPQTPTAPIQEQTSLEPISSSGPPVELEPLVSLSLPISGFYNNKGTSETGEQVNGEGFDGGGATYPSEFLPTGLWVDEGVEFILPEDWSALTDDNVVALSQIIPLPEPTPVNSVHLLVAGDGTDGETTETIGLSFQDGSHGELELDLKNWWAIHWLNKAAIRCPYHFLSPTSKNFNTTQIHHLILPLPPHLSFLPLVSLSLPERAGWNALHIFSATLIPSVPIKNNSDPYPIRVRLVRGTHKWLDFPGGRTRAQIVEVTLSNPFAVNEHGRRKAWVGGRGLEVELVGRAVRTVVKGRIKRLMPGDEVVVQIGVEPGDVTVSSSQDATVEVVLREIIGSGVEGSAERSGVVGWQTVEVQGSGILKDRGWGEWIDDVVALEQHESPDWFNNAKFGIFIHFGLFSVPAWTEPGRYSEWYWYWLHQDGPNGGISQGEDFVYDDFIASFNGSKFDATAWIDLFTGAGAKYFVLTTKHHDGFALFDTKHTSDRNSVVLGPEGGKRDYVKELLEAADKSPIPIKKGTYFSMPEWFNPDYKPYGWQGWPGGLAEDVFHPGKFEPYTGRTKINDYVEDLQQEQMRILTRDYKIDILWCDIGGANHTSVLAAEWWTNATKEGRQVAMNNRCGVAPDFSTPEYAQFKTIQSNKWESCEGLDPWSFGYNKKTPDDQYRSVKEIVHKLIDITAKNGNYLLNVGPTGEGEIIDAMSSRLLKVGRWLETNGRAIYDTNPFALLPELVVPEKKLNLRFTRTENSFFILSLSKPKSVFIIPARLPILEGDRISFLGRKGPVEVDWEWVEEKGELRILIGEVGNARVELDREKVAWVFEVEYGG